MDVRWRYKTVSSNVLLNIQLGNTAAAQNGFEIVVDKVNKLILSPQKVHRSSYKDMSKLSVSLKKSFLTIHNLYKFAVVQNGS